MKGFIVCLTLFHFRANKRKKHKQRERKRGECCGAAATCGEGGGGKRGGSGERREARGVLRRSRNLRRRGGGKRGGLLRRSRNLRRKGGGKGRGLLRRSRYLRRRGRREVLKQAAVVPLQYLGRERRKKGKNLGKTDLFSNFAGDNKKKSPMDEKKLEAKKHFAGEKRPSMKRRDDCHDYQERRMYMITIEVTGRQPLLGTLRGTASALPGSTDAPRLELSELGRAVEREWWGISRYYPQIEVKALQLMPDHLHGILFVRERLPVHLGHVIRGFKTGCNKKLRELQAAGVVAAQPQPAEKGRREAAGSVAAQPLPAEKERREARGVVAAQPLPAEKERREGTGLFVQGYNDLILRSYEELQRWRHYLQDNPRRLLLKREHPEWLYPFFGLHVKGYVLNGIGNRSLLQGTRRVNVRISRRTTEAELERSVKQYLEAAEKGYVLVSPSISPGEKEVMRAAFDRGFPTIAIVPKGFSPLSKPKGEQFDACAAGRLLLLSNHDYSNEQVVLTKPLCEEMNLIALTICQS